MGSSLQSGNPFAPKHQMHIESTVVAKTNHELLLYSIKHYEQKDSLTVHRQIEALVKRKHPFYYYSDRKDTDVLRISFASNGLTMHYQNKPRDTNFIQINNYLVLRHQRKEAFQKLMKKIKKYERLAYSLLCNNCKTFVEEIVKGLDDFCFCTNESLTVWNSQSQFSEN